MSPPLHLRRADAGVADALVACVRDPDEPSLPSRISTLAERGRLPALLGLAERHRVLGSVARPLRRAPQIPTEDRDGLEARLARQAARHLRVLQDLRVVASALADIPWFVAKGPVLAELVYPTPELRSYGDLDLFVQAERFAHAVRALEAAGATIEDRNWALLRRDRRGQLHVRLALGTLADLHWHLVNRGAVRDMFRIPMRDLFERVRPEQVAGLTVPVLDPTDALLHLALHASLSGCNRLVWLQDVSLMLRAGGVHLEELVRRARAWRIDAPAAIALDHASRVLGAPVPSAIVDELHGSVARRYACHRLARLWPPERSTGQDPAALWAQLARGTWPATAEATRRRIGRAIRGWFAPPEDHAALRPVGRAEGREAFLVAVARDRDHRRSRG